MKKIVFEPTYKKENGLEVISESSIPFPENFIIKTRSLIIFPPGAMGGNHKHPRKEAFYATGDLTMVWVDKKGKKITESMAPRNGKYVLFLTEINRAHTVINRTDNEIVLVEFANEEQHDVEPIVLI
jgi:oxalate decarboxylase/phosphoglucose isomerase-like protein (cupin superfamily)